MGYYSSIALCLSSLAHNKFTNLHGKLNLNPSINKCVNDHEKKINKTREEIWPPNKKIIKDFLDRCFFFYIDKKNTVLYFWDSEKITDKIINQRYFMLL
jgi:hypothetical protein